MSLFSFVPFYPTHSFLYPSLKPRILFNIYSHKNIPQNERKILVLHFEVDHTQTSATRTPPCGGIAAEKIINQCFNSHPI